MNILVVSATEMEISSSISFFKKNKKENHILNFLITGVGQMYSCFSLSQILSDKKFDLVIQAGICGSVSKNFELGQVIHIVEDEVIDVGSSSEDSFLPIRQLDIFTTSTFKQKMKFNPSKTVKTPLLETVIKGSGITSNTAHGDHFWIQYLHYNFPNSFESMEGASSFFVCNHFNTPVIQIRAISNYIEIRDRSKWEVKKAISQLNQFLIQLIDDV